MLNQIQPPHAELPKSSQIYTHILSCMIWYLPTTSCFKSVKARTDMSQVIITKKRFNKSPKHVRTEPKKELRSLLKPRMFFSAVSVDLSTRKGDETVMGKCAALFISTESSKLVLIHHPLYMGCVQGMGAQAISFQAQGRDHNHELMECWVRMAYWHNEMGVFGKSWRPSRQGQRWIDNSSPSSPPFPAADWVGKRVRSVHSSLSPATYSSSSWRLSRHSQTKRVIFPASSTTSLSSGAFLMVRKWGPSAGFQSVKVVRAFYKNAPSLVSATVDHHICN